MSSQPLKWHGGKSYLAAWIQSLAPDSVLDDATNGYTHRNIVFAGGLGEFWNWPCERISEAVNDLNGELVNFYGVLADPDKFALFGRVVSVMPLAESVFDAIRKGKFDTEIARAVAFFVKYRMSRQGLGKCYCTPTTRTRRGMNENVSAWLSAVDGLPECFDRLLRVELRNMDFGDFIEAYDHPRALFYLDPPYLHETRQTTGEYECEMDDAAHGRLLAQLASIKGRFMLSGYRSTLYDSYAAGYDWIRSDRITSCASSSNKVKADRVECVWTNYLPPERLENAA